MTCVMARRRKAALRFRLVRFPPKTRTRPRSNDDQAQFVRADETCGTFVQRRRVRARPRELRNRDAHPLYAARTATKFATERPPAVQQESLGLHRHGDCNGTFTNLVNLVGGLRGLSM